MRIDPLIAVTAQSSLALLMLASGLHKACRQREFSASVAAYRIVPAPCVEAVALALTGMEIGVSPILILPATRVLGAFASMTLLALYFSVVAQSLLRGHRLQNCGCTLSSRGAPLSPQHLMRIGFVISFAILAAMPRSARVLDGQDFVQAAAAVLSLALAYLAVDSLLAHRAPTYVRPNFGGSSA
jgi:hypothetical protein